MGYYRLQIFMGPMWSGKTNRLIQAVDIARQNYHQVIVIKPLLDNRLLSGTKTTTIDPTVTVSPSSSSSLSSVTAPSPIIRARTGLSLPVDLYINELPRNLPTTHNNHHNKPILYAIDEAQFFGSTLIPFWEQIVNSSSPHSLLVSGLDYDYRRQPFGSLLSLATSALLHPKPLASQIYRLTARCAYQGRHRQPSSSTSAHQPCNKPAAFTQRLKKGGTDVILVGGEEAYAPACDQHHIPEPVDEDVWGRVG